MATYKLADGTFIDGPDKPNAEQAAWLKTEGGTLKETPSVIKDVIKQGVTGLAEGAVRAPFIGADLLNLAGQGINKIWPDKLPKALMPTDEMPSSWALNKLSEATGITPPKAETTAGKYANSIGNGVGGSVLSLGAGPALSLGKEGLKAAISRMLQNPALQGAVVGGAGELAGQASAGFDPGASQSGVARFLGGAVPAIGMAMAGHAMSPTYGSTIYNAGKDLTPADFAAAQLKAVQMQAAGAKSTTLADTLPATSQLRAAASEVASSSAGSELYHKLAGRQDGDIAAILKSAKNDAQDVAVPGYAGSETGVARDIAISNAARQNRTGALQAELQKAGPMDEQQMQAVVKALEARAANVANAGTDDAMYAASGAGAVKGMPPLPGTGVPAINPQAQPQFPMLQAKGFENASGKSLPMLPAEASTPAVPAQYNLEAVSKKVKSLEMQGAIAGGEGPAGQVLKNAAAVQASKTGDLALKSVSPEYDAAIAAYKAHSPRVDIARLLEENKLQPQTSQQGATLASDTLRENLSKALQKIDPSRGKSIDNKIDTANTLNQLHPTPGLEGTQQVFGSTALANAVSPHQGLKNWLRGMGRDKANKEVAQILANPTPENYALLQAMVKRDPKLGRYLRDAGNVGSVNSVTQTKGSEP